MGEFDGRPKRDHVHTRIFFPDDSALKTRVDRCHVRFLAKKILVDVFEGFKQRGLQIGLPSRIALFQVDSGAA